MICEGLLHQNYHKTPFPDLDIHEHLKGVSNLCFCPWSITKKNVTVQDAALFMILGIHSYVYVHSVARSSREKCPSSGHVWPSHWFHSCVRVVPDSG